MLSQNLKNKKVAILGRKTIIGKIMLKKLIQYFGNCLTNIIVIDLSKNNKSNQTLYEETFLQDQYFKGLDLVLVNKIVQFINISQKVEYEDIDILYSCLLPVDYTKSPVQQVLETQIWKTLTICKFLKSFKSIQKLVLVSSLYGQSPGFVSQNINRQQNKLMFIPNFQSREKLIEDVSDVFETDMEIWQWSIMFMESAYTKQQNIKKTEIVRIPQIGPTITNYEGFFLNFNSLMTLIYDVGNNFVDSLEGLSHNIIDLMPADFVVNYMVSVSALLPSPLIATDPEVVINTEEQQKNGIINKFSIHNLSSSSLNPITFEKFTRYIVEAWAEFSNKRINFKIQQKVWQKKMYTLKNNLPQQVKNRIAILFDVKPWKIQAQQNNVSLTKKREIIKKYKYYLSKEWICESNKSIDYFFSMSQQDQINFNFNANTINWKTYAKLCCYSIKKYLLSEEIQKFSPSNLDLLSLKRSSTYFSDIVWALGQGKSIQSRSVQEMKNYILSTKSVKQAIKQLIEEQTSKLEQAPMPYQKVEEEYYRIANQMCDQMFSQYSMKSIRGFAWFLHKVFRAIYQKVVIDKASISKLRSYDQKNNGPIILIPTHRSYIDFLIMSYVFFCYEIKCPHVAAAQDFLNMAVIHILLRKSGAFFIKRNQKKNRVLYKAVMTEYLTKLLTQNHYLQFFIQGTRSRVGKMLSPKYGLLSIVAKNVLEGKIPDAQILPVTLNYQKVLEGTSFTYQMMGQSKVKESLSRLIKAADVLKENYGRIYVEFCDFISVKDYFKINSDKHSGKKGSFELILNDLGYTIVHSMTNKLVISPPAILSSIILMNRIGISDEKLSQKVQWLCLEISQRNVKIARTQADSSISVSNTLSLMEQMVTKSKKDMFELQVSFDQSSFAQLFTLVYYRNTLTHIFFEEAIIAVALASFGHQKMITGSIQLNQLLDSIVFLRNLLKVEYVLQNFLDNENRIIFVLQYMQKRGVIKKTVDNKFCVLQPDANIFNFYCSLVWPLIQSYWITCLYLFKLQKDNQIIAMTKLQSEIQWFGQSLFTERVLLHLQAISADTLKNSTATLMKMKIIGQVKQGTKNGVKVTASEENLKKLERKIQIYLKSKYAGSLKGIINTGRSSVNLDFPFLSKL